MSKSWLLPESIADILPSEARKIEELRRGLLDDFRSYGYELVMPPLLEYLESLLTGTGHDLSLRTFKLIDQLSGRTMGLRADITPQVARIDAHLLNRSGVTRLCYSGSVLHTRAAGFHSTREPIQAGAEIYGHAGIEADIEIQELMLAALRRAGLADIRVDLCHAGILEALLAGLPNSENIENIDQEALFAALEAKEQTALDGLLRGLSGPSVDGLRALPALYGEPAEVLVRAAKALPAAPAIAKALDELATLAKAAEAAGQGVSASLDLSDLRGYHYHSGVMFAAYVAGLPNAVARGGRYDRVGQAFGRARPATGFSLDLRELAGLSPIEARTTAILAPWDQDLELVKKIKELRQSGEVVIQSLPGNQHDLDEFSCDRMLTLRDGQWTVVPRPA
ncbi:MAG: ATP phosphoribosyltransferase regulatory subunit [Candidatus Protistobacter heckmanni]|nr:ATP phosphoribosyltransferase regulatory subunit [Candidatus Protistobacter heckmanni]